MAYTSAVKEASLHRCISFCPFLCIHLEDCSIMKGGASHSVPFSASIRRTAPSWKVVHLIPTLSLHPSQGLLHHERWCISFQPFLCIHPEECSIMKGGTSHSVPFSISILRTAPSWKVVHFIPTISLHPSRGLLHHERWASHSIPFSAANYFEVVYRFYRTCNAEAYSDDLAQAPFHVEIFNYWNIDNSLWFYNTMDKGTF